MASPVGHALCGITCLMVVEIAKPTHFRSFGWKNVFLYAFLANLPDIDFLIGYLISSDPHRFHSGPTHSIVFALTAGLFFGLLCFRQFGPLLGWLIPTVVILSHSIIDLFTGPVQGFYTSYGVALFWPLDESRIKVPLSLFLGVHHDNWERLLSLHNARVIGSELLGFMPPILVLAFWAVRKEKLHRSAASRKSP